MNVLITIVVIVGVLLLGFVIVPFLRKKGWLTKEDAATTEQIMVIAELILDKIKFKNEDIQRDLLLIFDITDQAVQYVNKIIDVTDIETKKQLAKNAVFEVLNELKVPVDDKIEELVNAGVDAAIDHIQ